MVKSLGCKVHLLHCEPNGNFPRGPEPIASNLKLLGKSVIKHKADIGIATDPDGDRLAIVDEKGYPLSEEYTLTICADGFFRATSSKKPIITNLSTTMALDKIAERYGSRVIHTAVGEINVVNKMPQYFMIKEKIQLNNVDPKVALKKIEDANPNAISNKNDGLKLSWNDSWIHIRKSNTEPIIRIYAEANTFDTASKLIEDVKNIL